MSRKRIQRSVTLLMLRERVLPAVVILALLLGFGWFTTTGQDTPVEYCLKRYARAATARDSATVDITRQSSLSRPCGDLRRDGSLARRP